MDVQSLVEFLGGCEYFSVFKPAELELLAGADRTQNLRVW